MTLRYVDINGFKQAEIVNAIEDSSFRAEESDIDHFGNLDSED